LSPGVAVADIPAVSVQQMREVDRTMVEDLGIGLLQMMENAGRALARRARVMLGGDAAGRRVTILAGSGGNGGGGMVAGRRLALWGADVTVVLAQPAESMAGVPAQQLAILGRIGVPVHGPGTQLPAAHLLVDALLGYSLQGAPRPPVASLIRAANTADTPILALDIPSGLDGDRGIPYDPCIVAAATLTLALTKTGLLQRPAEKHVGDLYLADISVPPSVYDHMGLHVGAIFGRDDVVAVR
jgi:NAD(P)H-hydrate epimerase